MKTNSFPRNLALLSVLSSLSCSGSGSSGVSGCKTDGDCPGDEVCVSGVCSGGEVDSPSQLEELVFNEGVTDSSGRVVVGDVTARVVHGNTGVADVRVVSYFNGLQTDVIALPNSSYVANMVSVPFDTSVQNVNSALIARVDSEFDLIQQAARAEMVISLETIEELGNTYTALKEARGGTVIRGSRYVVEVCMTRAQVEHSVVAVPNAILDFAGQGERFGTFAGYFSSFRDMIFDVMVPQFGEYGNVEGYIVSLPQVAVAFDNPEFIADPVTKVLYGGSISFLGSQIERAGVWAIVGSCSPRDNADCSYTAGKVCGGANNDIVFQRDVCGAQYELSRCGFEEICSSGRCRSVDDEGLPACAHDDTLRDLYCAGSAVIGTNACGESVRVDDCYERRGVDNHRMTCRDGACVDRDGTVCSLQGRSCIDNRVVEVDTCGNTRDIEVCDSSANLYCVNGACSAGDVEVLDGIDNNGDGRFNEGFVGTGPLQIILDWNSAADLDLHVQVPNGCEIFYDRPACGGGRLDRDAHSNCDPLANSPPENIFWAAAPESGEFIVKVHNYKSCGTNGVVPFQVGVALDGRVTMYNGQVGPNQTVEATRINVP